MLAPAFRRNRQSMCTPTLPLERLKQMLYPKINGVFKRDKQGKFLEGLWACPEYSLLKDVPWEWTEKVDGTNIRLMRTSEKWDIGGRTDNAQIPSKLYTVLRDLTEDPLFDLWVLKHNLTNTPINLFGEGYGSGIQKVGSSYRPDNGFVLFDVNINGSWLSRDKVIEVAQELQIDVVPEVSHGTTLSIMLDHMMNRGSRIPSAWENVEIEGLVGRPLGGLLYDRRNNRITTKLKYKDFE